MAKSRMSILKRQRERKKAEKAARKRAKRHGMPGEPLEPRPTVVFGVGGGVAAETPDDDAHEQEKEES